MGQTKQKKSTGAAAIIESVSLLDAHTPQTDTGSPFNTSTPK